ncbi:MAG: DMT family transporter [Hyphomicrobiales bacterium]
MINPAITKTMSPLVWGMLILLSVLWGGSFFFQGVAVQELPTFTVVVARVGLAALALWLILPMLKVHMPKTGAAWKAFFGMAVLNNVIPFTLIVWGQSHIASGLASIFNSMMPVFTIVIAHFLTADEKMTPRKVTGVILGIMGVVVLIGGDALDGLGVNLFAQLAILGAGVSYGFAGIWGRRFSAMGIKPMASATGQLTASTLVLFPVMLLVDKPWTLALPSQFTMASLMSLAIFSTAFAYVLVFNIIARAGATNLSLVTFLIPPSAILLGILFLNESLEIKHVIGMVFIGLALVVIDGRLLNRVK